MRISDLSSDVCSSDLPRPGLPGPRVPARLHPLQRGHRRARRPGVRGDRQGGRGLLAGHAAARGGGGMNAPVPGARASPGKTVVERMDSKELLDSALNALDRLLKMFMIERYVYLVLTAVSFLLLLYAGSLLEIGRASWRDEGCQYGWISGE